MKTSMRTFKTESTEAQILTPKKYRRFLELELFKMAVQLLIATVD